MPSGSTAADEVLVRFAAASVDVLRLLGLLECDGACGRRFPRPAGRHERRFLVWRLRGRQRRLLAEPEQPLDP
jgi:hypothetical protein